MTLPAIPDERSESDRRRDLRSIVADGVFFSAMVGLGETYVPAFALATGLGEVVAGLIATLPMLAGAVLQLVTPWAVRHLGSYRRWVVLCARLQALSFVPLVVGAALGRLSVAWLAVSAVSYWAFGMATGPAWNAWVSSLVPPAMRARFFANRARLAQTTLVAGILLGGVLLQWGRGRDAELELFAALFVVALLARFVSAGFLARQSEPPGLAREHAALSPREVLASIRSAGSTRVLAYLLGIQAAVNVAAPYFTPYMLGPLGLSYSRFMLLTAASFLARVAVLPLLGRIAEKRGTRLLLWWGAVGIVPLPVLWLVSDDFRYLLCLQLVAGAAWAALELATLLSFFERIDDRARASVLTVFNLGTAAAVGLGALAGSRVFVELGDGSGVYAWLFWISSAGRLAMLAVLRGVPSVRVILGLRLRTLAVRPSAGAIQRPILASVTPAGDPDPGPVGPPRSPSSDGPLHPGSHP